MLSVCLLFRFVRIPGSDGSKYGEIRQGVRCMDTLGHAAGGTIGMYRCHGDAGNQVCVCAYSRLLIHTRF